MSIHFPNLKRDLLWNYMSFALMVFTGVMINVVIGRVYGPEALGTFNLLYAIFIIASQFSTMGLHYSCLKHVAEERDETQQAIIGYSALACGLAISIFCALFLAVFQDVIGRLFASESVANGLFYLLPGLVFIALNKIMLWILNGRKQMVALAQANMLRALLITGFLVALIFLYVKPYVLASIFTLADGVLLLFLGFKFFKTYGFSKNFVEKKWGLTHLRFGFKAFWGGVILDTNFRVDIIMLGLLMNEHTVGLYSLTAMIVEGLNNLLFVLRTQLNPVLVVLTREQNHEAIRDLIKKTAFYLYPVMAGIFILAAIFYTPVLRLVGLDAFILSYTPLLILLIGVGIAAPFIPFYEIFMQAGQSGRYSQFMAYVIVTNIALNACLIPLFGMSGAALGTALAFVLSILYFRILCAKHLNFKIFKA